MAVNAKKLRFGCLGRFIISRTTTSEDVSIFIDIQVLSGDMFRGIHPKCGLRLRCPLIPSLLLRTALCALIHDHGELFVLS